MDTIIKKVTRDDFIFNTIQRGKRKPVKYKHYLKIPSSLYQELKDENVIDMQFFCNDELVFIEFDPNITTFNFICLYVCEDFHRKIDCYIIKKLLGFYPITRGGFFI